MSESQSFLDRHHFLLRRLHSLAGVIPIGVFLIMHLTTNSSVVWAEALGKDGAATFQHEVNFIHSLPGLILIEIFGLWLPIFFHAIFGFYYAFTGKSNVASYPYGGSWRYSLQRWSGYLGFVFIFFHIATLRWGWDFLPFAAGFDAERAASSTAVAVRGGADGGTIGAVVVGAIYLIGVTSLVYHFANGLWTWAITWGLTITPQAQKRWGYVCAVIGVGLMGAGWGAYAGFVTLDIEEAAATELRMSAPGLTDAEPSDTGREESELPGRTNPEGEG